MSRTPTQNKALAWYIQENNLMPQLSTHPTYYFKNKNTNEETHREIYHIVTDYKRYQSEQKRSKQRLG